MTTNNSEINTLQELQLNKNAAISQKQSLKLLHDQQNKLNQLFPKNMSATTQQEFQFQSSKHNLDSIDLPSMQKVQQLDQSPQRPQINSDFTKNKRTYHLWSQEEIQILLETVKTMGGKWKAISAQYLPGLTPQQIKNKYYQIRATQLLQTKRPTTDAVYSQIKVQTLQDLPVAQVAVRQVQGIKSNTTKDLGQAGAQNTVTTTDSPSFDALFEI